MTVGPGRERETDLLYFFNFELHCIPFFFFFNIYLFGWVLVAAGRLLSCGI